MEISSKSSLPIIKTGLRRWSSSLSAMKTTPQDAPLQSSLDRYKEKDAGEVPKVSHNLDHVRGYLMQKLVKITQGSSYGARNYHSEEAQSIGEVYRSSSKVDKATTPSVLPGYCKKSISTKRSHSLQDNSKKMVPCNYNSVDLEQNGNKGILKFVPPGTEKGDILLAFLGWADILEIEISDDGDVYRLAYLYFKNREELVKALNRTDLIVRNKTVVLEAASTVENVSNKLPELGWVGAQTVPHEEIKNASRTVMIRRFGCKITLGELRKVLAFCGGNMSGIFFGPSSSSAYVEFETEDDKEMALAKHPIHVMGKPISILRIDTPRTTVVRISYGDISGEKVSSVCTSLGKVKRFVWRCPGIVDAHYCFSEWPKMVEILNGLNGLDLDGNRVLAQPATNYPPDVLNSLWSQPGERKHIRKMVLDLLEKLRNNSAQTVDLIRLADRFYNNEH